MEDKVDCGRILTEAIKLDELLLCILNRMLLILQVHCCYGDDDDEWSEIVNEFFIVLCVLRFLGDRDCEYKMLILFLKGI